MGGLIYSLVPLIVVFDKILWFLILSNGLVVLKSLLDKDGVIYIGIDVTTSILAKLITVF